MSTTTTGKAPRCSQNELATILGCDRTTIRAMQETGLPYINQGRGKSAEYIIPLAVNWAIGYWATRKKGVADEFRSLSGTLDPLCFSLASKEADGDQVDESVFAEHLRACGEKAAADQLVKRVGYFEGMING